MEFLAPVMLVGALGAAIPVAIHLIGRRRAPIVKFAAMDFLLSSDKKVARRLQLRELLLLAVRVLACIAIPLALAKPFTACETAGPHVTRGPQAAVIIIDNSLVSSYRLGDQTLLARAQSRARSVLDQMGPEADVAIALVAEGSTPPEELARDHLQLRDRISDIQTSARPPDTANALSRAARLLSQSNQQRKTIFLLSPLTATGFSRRCIRPGARQRRAHCYRPDRRSSPRERCSGQRRGRARSQRRFSRRARHRRSRELRYSRYRRPRRETTSRRTRHRDGLPCPCAPVSERMKHFAAALPEGTRIADVAIELEADALALDDRRYGARPAPSPGADVARQRRPTHGAPRR